MGWHILYVNKVFVPNTSLTCHNCTTIESLEGTRYIGHSQTQELSRERVGNVFDIGISRNWRCVMGEHWWTWLFPTKP